MFCCLLSFSAHGIEVIDHGFGDVFIKAGQGNNAHIIALLDIDLLAIVWHVHVGAGNMQRSTLLPGKAYGADLVSLQDKTGRFQLLVRSSRESSIYFSSLRAAP